MSHCNGSALGQTLNEVVSHDSSYRDVFWELGIVQALLHTVLERFARNSCDPVSSGLLRSAYLFYV